MHFKWKFLFVHFFLFCYLIFSFVLFISALREMLLFYNDNPILSCFLFSLFIAERLGDCSRLCEWVRRGGGKSDSVWKDFPSSYFALS